MLLIGLTGGIGSGKSLAAHYFSALGVPVIDADALARELVTPGSVVLAEIVELFGPACLLPDGQLDRDYLRRIVFQDAQLRQRLEAILHPRIHHEMLRRAAALHAPYCILVIPLLVESGWRDAVHRILVIDAPEALQITRVQARQGLTEKEIGAIMQTQARREQRLAVADDVIVNDGTPEQLRHQIEQLHDRYLTLAGHYRH